MTAVVTKAQQRVLDFYIQYNMEYGFPPTRREIAAALGFSSPNAAQDHLVALSRRGAIMLHRRKARGFTKLIAHTG